MSGQYSQAQLDAIAREQGFPDYASWKAWNEKYRSTVRTGDTQKPAPKNFLQSLADRIPIHPSYILNYVTDKFRGATEK